MGVMERQNICVRGAVQAGTTPNDSCTVFTQARAAKSRYGERNVPKFRHWCTLLPPQHSETLHSELQKYAG